MFSHAALRSRAPQPDPVALQPRAFWKVYTDWTASASLDELEQFQSTLDRFYDAESDSYFEAQSVVTRIRESLGCPESEARFPVSLIHALHHAGWPAAAAHH
jgi:hypothetical protein